MEAVVCLGAEVKGEGCCRAGSWWPTQTRWGKWGTIEVVDETGSWSSRKISGIQGVEQISIEDHGSLFLIIQEGIYK